MLVQVQMTLVDLLAEVCEDPSAGDLGSLLKVLIREIPIGLYRWGRVERAS